MYNKNKFKLVDYVYIIAGITTITFFTYMAIQPRLSHVAIKTVPVTALLKP